MLVICSDRGTRKQIRYGFNLVTDLFEPNRTWAEAEITHGPRPFVPDPCAASPPDPVSSFPPFSPI
jgi:hypothetical protein